MARRYDVKPYNSIKSYHATDTLNQVATLLHVSRSISYRGLIVSIELFCVIFSALVFSVPFFSAVWCRRLVWRLSEPYVGFFIDRRKCENSIFRYSVLRLTVDLDGSYSLSYVSNEYTPAAREKENGRPWNTRVSKRFDYFLRAGIGRVAGSRRISTLTLHTCGMNANKKNSVTARINSTVRQSMATAPLPCFPLSCAMPPLMLANNGRTGETTTTAVSQSPQIFGMTNSKNHEETKPIDPEIAGFAHPVAGNLSNYNNIN